MVGLGAPFWSLGLRVVIASYSPDCRKPEGSNGLVRSPIRRACFRDSSVEEFYHCTLLAVNAELRFFLDLMVDINSSKLLYQKPIPIIWEMRTFSSSTACWKSPSSDPPVHRATFHLNVCYGSFCPLSQGCSCPWKLRLLLCPGLHLCHSYR